MSRFVPAGTDPGSGSNEKEDDAWTKARQQIEALKKPKPVDEGKQEGGESLYDVLQRNKGKDRFLTPCTFASTAAKQEAFEESIKLKNQFRALDDDEVDFLDSVLESERAKEDAVKKEMSEQLEAFRNQRAKAEKDLLEHEIPEAEERLGAPVGKNAWTTQKKRRRRDEESKAIASNKTRKLSSSADNTPQQPTAPKESGELAKPLEAANQSSPAQVKSTPGVLGLGDYSSDED
ncbi:hypothetical protein PV08_08589 [Exophiala spinifera]|uniref:FAM192A/Fyv6 N-terminal domain-containing protein n=1 Tax=Exophiala spinifera TaxID=91928 RepID=A0A0D1YE83_9EURO|nr:uncharacterized protein PV08_08589 [Exophiala spinifera]KIW13401.1 hypothetical protein PV08_08589 [Exophiala spinifera]